MADSKKRKADMDALEVANKRIAIAKEKYLPMMPHLLELPKDHKPVLVHDEIFERQLRNESTNTFSFTPDEWKNMQYMTFVNVERRGVTSTRGAWEDDMARWGRTPEEIREAEARSRSSSGTPNPDGPKKPKVKIALKDYVHRKTGIRPPSIPTTASPTPDIQDASAKSNGVGAQSLNTSLTQVLAEKSSAAKKDSATDPVKQAKAFASNTAERLSSHQSHNSVTRESALPAINGAARPPPAEHRSMPITNGISNGLATSTSQEKPFSATNGAVKPPSNGIKSASNEAYNNNAHAASAHHKSSSNDAKTSLSQHQIGPAKNQPRPATNGITASKGLSQGKEVTKDVMRPGQQPLIQHALPKKPTSSLVRTEIIKTSTPRSANPLFQGPPGSKKRESPSEDAPAEKRAKIDHSGTPSISTHSRTPSNSHNPLPRKPDPSGLPPKPRISSGPTSHPSSHPSPRPNPNSNPNSNSNSNSNPNSSSKPVNKDVRKLGTPRPGNSKSGTPRSDTPRSEMAKDIPPLLSPLHPAFESSPLSEPPTSSVPSSFSKSKKLDDLHPSSKTAADKGKGVAKKPAQRSLSPEESMGTGSRALPPLLSPQLPAVIEEALKKAEEQKKSLQVAEESQKNSYQTVEERHELARRENAPGVARKTVKSKTGKRNPAPEPSFADEPTMSDERRPCLVLKIKKSSRTNAKRILNSRPQPGRGLTDAPLPKAYMLNTSADSSDDDLPLAKTVAKKKRPSDSGALEPTAKRVKGESRDMARTSSATSTARKSTPLPTVRKSTPLPTARIATPIPSARLDSPVPSIANNKNLLATPKKGDAMKSVAMRKVDSSEGFARTPQPTMTSTPASVERSRTSATSEPRPPVNPDIEKLRADAISSSALALKIKRKMDDLLKLKVQPRPVLPEKDRKQGLATGLECLTVYMNSYFRTDQATVMSGHPRQYRSWNDISGVVRFLEHECTDFPVLHALACQLGAICYDQLERSCMDIRDPALRVEKWDMMEKNNKAKNRFWEKAEEKKSVLAPFSGGQTLGPWSNIKDITTHTIGIITAFSRKEQSGWKKDPEFSSLLT